MRVAPVPLHDGSTLDKSDVKREQRESMKLGWVVLLRSPHSRGLKSIHHLVRYLYDLLDGSSSQIGWHIHNIYALLCIKVIKLLLVGK